MFSFIGRQVLPHLRQFVWNPRLVNSFSFEYKSLLLWKPVIGSIGSLWFDYTCFGLSNWLSWVTTYCEIGLIAFLFNTWWLLILLGFLHFFIFVLIFFSFLLDNFFVYFYILLILLMIFLIRYKVYENSFVILRIDAAIFVTFRFCLLFGIELLYNWVE